MNYQKKYIKYKNKYLQLQNIINSNNLKGGAASSIDDPKEADPTAPTSMPTQDQKGGTCWAHAYTRSVVRTFQVLNIITNDKVKQWYDVFYNILLQDRTCDSGGDFSDMIRLYNYLKNNIDSIIDKIFDNPLTEDQIKIKEKLKFLFENEIIFPAKYPYAVNPGDLNLPTQAIINMLNLGLQPALDMTFSVSLLEFLSSKISEEYDLFSDKDIITDCDSGISHAVVLKEWFEDHLKIRNSWGVYRNFSVKNLKELICTRKKKYLDTIIDFECLMIDTVKLISNNFVIKKYRSIIDSTLPITKHNYTDNYDDYGFPHGENCELKDYNNNTFFQGKLIHGIKNGKGIFTFSYGRYEGDWENDQKHGKGIETRVSTYEGDWVNNKKHGKGSIKYPGGVTYVGDWKDDKICGKGSMKYPDGSTYEGDWIDYKKHGKGIQTEQNGSIYNGDWVDNKKHGKGNQREQNGSIYMGSFQNDKKHGNGFFSYQTLTYSGNWVNDKRHGTGIERQNASIIYQGNWENDKKHGKGKYTYPDNSKYEGDWENDKRHGKGIYTYSNGLTYDGDWAYDKKHGKGTEKMEDGSVYTSNWNFDKKLD